MSLHPPHVFRSRALSALISASPPFGQHVHRTTRRLHALQVKSLTRRLAHIVATGSISNKDTSTMPNAIHTSAVL